MSPATKTANASRAQHSLAHMRFVLGALSGAAVTSVVLSRVVRHAHEASVREHREIFPMSHLSAWDLFEIGRDRESCFTDERRREAVVAYTERVGREPRY